MLQFLTQSSWADRIGWVLVHSLWQFALLAIAAIVLQRALQRCSAATRYRALLAAMLIIVAVPVATWFSLASADVPVTAVRFDPVETPVDVSSSQHGDDRMPMATLPAASPVELVAEPHAEPLRSEPAPIAPTFSWSMVKQRVEPWLPEIVLVWFAGVLLAAFRPVLSWYTVRRLRTLGVSPVGGPVHDVLDRLIERLKLARAVQVLQSTLVKTPVVIGYFCPVVLLPLCVVTGLPTVQLELILAHELAHIRRHDYLVNLLQTLVETLFFYHPAVWWLSRQIRNERENCCDDAAMATVGSRADYGRALLAIEQLRATSPVFSLAARGGSLLARIRRIAGCEPAPRVVGGGGILAVILVSIAIFAAVAWAAAPAAEKPEPTATATVNRIEPATAAKDKEPTTPSVKWTVTGDFDSNDPYDPLVVNDKVVVGTNQGELRAYRCKDGEPVWKYKQGEQIFHRPCNDEKHIYFTSRKGLTAVTSADGSEVWNFDLTCCDGPACVIDKKGLVYAGGTDGNLYAVDAKTGKQRWRSDFIADAPPDPPDFPGERARTTDTKARPAGLATDGETLFLSVFDQCRVVAVNATTGKRLWSFQTRGWIFGTVVATKKHVFFGSQDDTFYCLNKETGKEVWRYRTKARIESGGAVDEKFVYFGSCDGSVYCLRRSDGKERWRFATDLQENGSASPIYSVPVLRRDSVWFAAGEGQTYAVDRDAGTLKWKIRPSQGSELFCSPATDGTLIFVTSRARDNEHGRPSLLAIVVPNGPEPADGLPQYDATPAAEKPEQTPPETSNDAEAKTAQPVSMSADEFSRLSAADQRALLLRVFKRRLEHADNIHFEADEITAWHENRNGEVGAPRSDPAPLHRQYQHWYLGDSFREDSEMYENAESTKVSYRGSHANNAVEGVARNIQFNLKNKTPPQGQVQYPINPTDNDPYVHWLSHSPEPPTYPNPVEYLFPYLLAHQNEFEIKAPVAGDFVQISFPWKPSWARQAGGKRVYLLDPRKGFLPVRCDSRYDDPPTSDHRMWRIERFTVEESRLVGDVWMPVKLTESVAASPVPNQFAVSRIAVSRIECGTVKLADLFIPFPAGTHVNGDILEGATYVVDAQGNPSNVKFESGWWQKPPAGWSRHEPADEALSWTSRILPADRERLAATRKALEEQSNEQKNVSQAALKVMRSSAPLDQRVEAGLKVLRAYKFSNAPDSDEAPWASVIRELIRIGPPAVPQLTAELDCTERGLSLRALGFVLRGIDDAKAIPAMIRAIPRTLQPPSSDCGLIIPSDPELTQFMQEYDNERIGRPRRPGSKSGCFSYGRPIREIMPTLQSMTGQSLGWNELNFVQLGSTAEQQRSQRKLYLQLARRWCEWWSKNWQRFVKSDADAQLDLIRESLDRYAKSISSPPAQPRTEFPCGPKVTVGGGERDSQPRSFDESPSEGFLDLDSGRQPNPPPELIRNSPRGKPSEALLAWAERQGVNLLTLKIKPSGSDKWYYAFKPLGMKVWRIDNDRYDHLQRELSNSKKLDLPTPWDGLLATVEEKTGKFDDKLTASYLFITKEGTCGAIQLRAPLNGGVYSDGGLQIQFIYESDAKKSPDAGPHGARPASAVTPRANKKPLSAADAWKPGQTLDFRLINAKTKEPLPGVKLELQFSGKGINFQDIKVQTTDAQGRSEIRLPDLKPDAVRVYTYKAGFVPLRVFWGSDFEPQSPPVIPKTVTIPVEPGTVWGGVVQNEKGEPIPNVKVSIYYWEPGSVFNPHLRANIDESVETVTTDKHGRWHIDVMPAKVVEDEVRIFLSHPDYVSDHLQRGMIPMPVTKMPSIKSLYSQTAVMVMRKGGVIEGRVTDETKRPIAGVRIYTEEYYWLGSRKPAAVTGEDGRFRIANVSFAQSGMNDPPPSTWRAIQSREVALVVRAPGYTPELIHADPSGSASPLEITLKPGQAVEGRVVDENGKPLNGVSVSISNWLGYRSRLDLTTETNADGKFRLNDAPLSGALYGFRKNGSMSVQDFAMSPQPNGQPGNEGYQVTLKAPLRVAGSIVDAETNRPPVKCTVIRGIDYDDGRAPEWRAYLGSKTITDGRYEFEFAQQIFCGRIRVEAEGYMPAVSRIFKPGGPDKGRVTYDFKLSKAAPMAGNVLGLDGKPLAGAEVYLATNLLIVNDGKASSQTRTDARMARTDTAGRFELLPEVEPFYLVVLHDQGYAVITEKQFAGAAAIRVEPWTAGNRSFRAERSPSTHSERARAADEKHALNVRLVDVDGKPVEGAYVSIYASFDARPNTFAPYESGWRYSPNISSDRDGMARIADQYGINCVIARHVERKLVAIQGISQEEMKGTLPVTITMQPQCEIVGKLTAKEMEARHRRLSWTNVYLCLDNGIGRPMSCSSQKADFHFYVSPGTYRLYAYSADTQHVWKTITVKPGQQKLEVEPIDLPPTGLVLLEGKPAPELHDVFAWKNGEPSNLADLRGKVVILAFSSGWKEPRGSIMPELFPLYDKYHDQGLVIIEIRHDFGLGESESKLKENLTEVTKPYWKDRDDPIPIALMHIIRAPRRPDAKTNWGCSILEDYGINGIPTGVLIDRQGRVVGRFDPRSNRAAAALDPVLAKVIEEK